MVHKPKHKVHSFKGLLGDGGEDEIRLERQNANVAYRITKLKIMTNTPGGANSVESVVKVYGESQSSIDSTVDFTDVNLLGVGVWSSGSTLYNNPEDMNVIFDNTLFSRNIYVTHSETQNNEACNYYIEIEEVPVSASTLIQLKLGTARRNIGGKIGPTPG